MAPARHSTAHGWAEEEEEAAAICNEAANGGGGGVSDGMGRGKCSNEPQSELKLAGEGLSSVAPAASLATGGGGGRSTNIHSSPRHPPFAR